MLRRDYERVIAGGLRLRAVYEERSLFTMTGRALRAGLRGGADIFIVVIEDPGAPGA